MDQGYILFLSKRNFSIGCKNASGKSVNRAVAASTSLPM